MISFTGSSTGCYNGEWTVQENYEGKSTDTKPVLTASRNGSTFFEIDTGNSYKFDGDTLTWLML